MGQALTDTAPDPNDKRFRLLQDEEGAPSPVPLPQGIGKPPAKPPIAPPAAVPAPDPGKKPNALELRIKFLEAENNELLCALYFMQQQYEELKKKESE